MNTNKVMHTNKTMHTRFTQLLKKGFLFSGVLFLGLASGLSSQAQSSSNSSTDNTGTGTDTIRRAGGMRPHWGNKDGSDHFAQREGFRSRSGGRMGGGREGRMGRHRNGIHYTPEQRTQVMAIQKEYHQKSADLFKNDKMTLGQYKAQLIALQKERKNKMDALLTPEQKDKLAQHKKQASENRQVMAAARLEKLRIRLSLNDDQVAKIKTGQENLSAQAKILHENEDLLPQQRRELLKNLFVKQQDNLKAVLTPEQLSKFQEMQKSHRHGPGA
ncbi:hypothetical protein ACX0G9_28455 [Flavitalea flava]